jgi:hypothetical protein
MKRAECAGEPGGRRPEGQSHQPSPALRNSFILPRPVFAMGQHTQTQYHCNRSVTLSITHNFRADECEWCRCAPMPNATLGGTRIDAVAVDLLVEV